MPKHLKNKPLGRSNKRHRKKCNNTIHKQNCKCSSRHKIGGSVTLVIPPIIRPDNGGSDSQAALDSLNNAAIKQNNIVNALTGGSGNAGTYTVPTFTNSGDPYSSVPNSNSVTRSLMGAFVKSQIDAEFDKNTSYHGGGRRTSTSNKLKKRKNRKSRKSRKLRKSKKH